ncbi:invasion associated locus B family protein [Aquabacter spiritensis]|uniref:Invasion protein IalB n=1 Tax=Aquabacter spiritensis TaxID=933073 RepID=A0A4R3M369_9HYPH|nr:invasion associated locus B family protein [Aquabacter spiritensis]TCT05605.1 invasion protein IalB [Aquabacter spiritensis]
MGFSIGLGIFQSRAGRLACGLAAGIAVLGLTAVDLAQAQTPAPAQTQPRKPATPPATAQKPALGSQDDNVPSRTSATYDDWVVRCERGESTGGVKVCEVAQTLQIGNQQQGLMAQVVFGKLKEDGPLRMVLQVPVGVWLPAGAQFTAGDNAKPIPAGFKFCIRACIADLDLTAQQAAALATASGSATLAFEDRNQAPISLPVSLKGLAPALAAREKM